MAFKFSWNLLKSLFAEFMSTMFFGFVVYAVIINTTITGNSVIRLVSIGVAVGFSAVAIIYSFRAHAPAHFNPAITLGAMVSLKLNPISGIFYMISQFLGAMASVGLVMIAFPNIVIDGEGLTYMISSMKAPNATIFQAMAMEFMLTFILVLICMGSAIGSVEPQSIVSLELPEKRERDDLESNRKMRVHTDSGSNRAGFAPIAIGFILGSLVFLGGASSGGTFNPALALAPSLFSGFWSQIYIYLVSEFLGGAFAGVFYILVWGRWAKMQTEEQEERDDRHRREAREAREAQTTTE